jgi:hypothetical protein
MTLYENKEDHMTNSHAAKVEKLRRKIKEAQDKYYALSHSVHDDFSVMSTASKDTEDGDGCATDDGTRITEVSQTVKEERKKARRKAKILRQLAEAEMEAAVQNGTNAAGEDGTVGGGVTVATGDTASALAKQVPRLMSATALQKLHDQIKGLNDSVVHSGLQIDSLKSENCVLVGERAVLVRKMQEMERRSEALRRAMGGKLNDDGDHQTAAECRLSVPQRLSHTPHLLDVARQQREAEWPVITGYEGPAVF